MPAAEVTVTLLSPLIVGDETIRAITLRAPTIRDLGECGYPGELIERNDIRFWKMHWDVLGALLRRCVTAPAGASEWIGELSLKDTYQLVDAFGPLWLTTEKAAASMTGLPVTDSKKKGT